MQETTKANPYVYAANDPVNEVDPSGKDAIGCFFAIVLTVADLLALTGTLLWADPPLGAAILGLQAIPVVGDLLAIIAAVILIAFNIWSYEATIYFDGKLISSQCDG